MILNRFNFYLMMLLVIANIFAMTVAPVLVVMTGYFSFFILLLPSLLLTNTLWALIHEGIHSNLNSDLKTSNFYSRILAVILHSNFEILKFGHLMHHRYNRTEYDLTEGVDSNLMADVSSKTPIKYRLYILRRTCTYYFHITIGIYLAELISPWLLFLPISWTLKVAKKIMGEDHPYIINAQNILLKPDKIRNIRIDNFINLLVIISIVMLYQQCLWIYLCYLLIRAFLISSIDNLPHYAASLDRINGSFNLKAPKIWQKMILNFNFHRVHHKYPYLAWHLLPNKFISEAEKFDHHYFVHYANQWNGVIEYKFDVNSTR